MLPSDVSFSHPQKVLRTLGVSRPLGDLTSRFMFIMILRKQILFVPDKGKLLNKNKRQRDCAERKTDYNPKSPRLLTPNRHGVQ